MHKVEIPRSAGSGRYTANVRAVDGNKLIVCLDFEFHLEKSMGLSEILEFALNQ